MPTVPVSGGPTIGQAATPNVQPSLAAFGGGQAPDLSGPAKAAFGIYQEEKQKADQIAVVDAGSKLSALETSLLYDPEHGALNRRGKDAFGIPEEVSGQWDTHVADIESSLTSDEQKLAFRRMVASHGAALNEQVQRHVAGERHAYDVEATGAYLNNEATAALSSYQDPARVQQSIDNRVAAITDFGRRNGVAPERVAQQVAQLRSETHTGVIDRILATGDDLTAKAYYDAHKTEISGDDAVKLDKALEEGSARGASQQHADDILASTKTLTEAVAQARAIKDPRVRDLTEQRIRQDFSEQQQADREQREASFQSATNVVERAKDVTKIPPSQWAKFTVQERESLRRYAEQLQGGGAVKTDWGTYYSLRTMATTDETRQTFLHRNLMLDRAALGDAQFKELVDLQGSLRAGDDKAHEKLDSFRTKDEIVTSTLRGIGLGVDPKKRTKDDPFIDVIKRSVDQQVELEQQRTGKPATTADVQKITDDIVTQHVVSSPGRFWGRNETSKRLYELAPEDSLVLSTKDIPRQDRQAIEQQLRAQRRPVTEQTVTEAYRAYLSNLVRRGPR